MNFQHCVLAFAAIVAAASATLQAVRNSPTASDDAGAGPSFVLVHIPRTGGTSIDHALRNLAPIIGAPFEFCNGAEELRMSCYHEYAGQAKKILSGEFLEQNLETLLSPTRPHHLWTFVRNPLTRSLLDVDKQTKAMKGMKGMQNMLQERRVLSKEECNLGANFCGKLEDPKRCRAGGALKPCGVFQDHMVRLLGYDSKSEDATEQRLLETALRRMEDGTIRVGLAEHFHASVCLILHEELGLADEAATNLFDVCCRVDVPTACPLLDAQNDYKSVEKESHVWREYLQHPEVRKELLESNKEDCKLYQKAHHIFVKRVREMERVRQVHLLPANEDGSPWYCGAWLTSVQHIGGWLR